MRKTILLFSLAALLAACADRPLDGPRNNQGIRLDFRPKTMVQAITQVTLTITVAGDTVVRETYAGAIAPLDTFDVPVADNVVFAAEAFDSARAMIYRGETVAGIGTDDFGTVVIIMRPMFVNWPGPFVGFVPAQVQATAGDKFTLEMVAGNMDSLFGFACQIVYDTTLLRITEGDITVGSLLGNSTVTVFKVDADTISVGVTRTNGQPGVSGSGTLVWLTFMAAAPGADTIKITDVNFKMIKADGSDVGNIGQVEKGNAVVEVK